MGKQTDPQPKCATTRNFNSKATCDLCGNSNTHYIKTYGGFRRLCKDCYKIIADNGLEAENLQILPMADCSGVAPEKEAKPNA